MLVLSRKPSEVIQIGDDIVIHVVRVRGNRVSLAIEAPRGREIRRGELSPIVETRQVVESIR